MSHPDEVSTCDIIDVIGKTVFEHVEEVLATNYLEQSILNYIFNKVDTSIDKIALYFKWLDCLQLRSKMHYQLHISYNDEIEPRQFV